LEIKVNTSQVDEIRSLIRKGARRLNQFFHARAVVGTLIRPGVLVTLLLLVTGCSNLLATQLISDFPDQTISEGERFERIFFADHLVSADDSDVTWRYTGAVDLRIDEVTGGVVVQLPDEDWNGAETVRFEACDAEGRCDSEDVTFTVLPENDTPVISEALIDRLASTGETFPPIPLGDFVSDVDNTVSEIDWACSGNIDLIVQITDQTAAVTAPSPTWSGAETIRFEACDPQGACAVKDITFTVTGDPSAVITFIQNTGFLISAGGKKVLTDALFEHCSYAPCSPSIMTRLEHAEPPFDDVDLVLVTHHHYDHFDPLVAGRHMENNPQAVFVSTPETVEELRADFSGFDSIADRVVAVPLDRHEMTQIEANGIVLDLMDLPHTDPNLGFLFDLGGCRLFHMGDGEGTLADVEPYQLPAREIDVVFAMHYQMIEHPNITLEGVQARHIVPTHFPPGNNEGFIDLMAPLFPQMVPLYESMESWTVTCPRR
jgi:L-ascorbate metabolism protein UlaG (beta-lactamase superfamily)